MASPHVLRIFALADIDLTGLSKFDKLSVACIITEIMMAMMRRAVAAGTKLPMNKSQFAMVARHLTQLATKCEPDSVFQALKVPRLRQSRPFVNELKGVLAEDNEDDDDELKASVLEIIAAANLTRCFPTSLLQPLPEALKRITGAGLSMAAEKMAAALGDVDHAALNSPLALAPASTPARRNSPLDLALRDACLSLPRPAGGLPSSRELGRSADKLEALCASVQKGLQNQAELSAFVHRRSEIDDGHFASTQSAINFGHTMQARDRVNLDAGFDRLNRGLGEVGKVSYQTLQNLATLSRATTAEQQAAAASRELQRESSVVMAGSFEALLAQVTK